MQILSIIIPVYNEKKLIEKVIDEVSSADSLGLKKEIIVVDDGSTDGTKIEVQRLVDSLKTKNTKHYSLITVHLLSNQGKGAALKAGFAKATGDILLVQDADQEYSTKDYPSLLKPFIENSTKAVYGSRNMARKKYHTSYSYLSFYLGGILLTWIVNILFGTHLTDQATGYKLFSKDLKPSLLAANENGFCYEVAVSAILAKQKVSFVEVPIHYKPRTIQDGKKINMMDFIKSVIVAMKYTVSS